MPDHPGGGGPVPPRAATFRWIQTAASALLLVLVFREVASIAKHGQEMTALGSLEVVDDPIVVPARCHRLGRRGPVQR